MTDSSPFSQEGFDLMAAAFEVHNLQGGGLVEEIYQESLEIELQLRGIVFNSRPEIQTFYKGQTLKRLERWQDRRGIGHQRRHRSTH